MARKPVDAIRLAYNYRLLVLWFGAQLLLTIVSMGLAATHGRTGPPALVALASGAVSLATIGVVVVLAIYSYRTADALGASIPVLWVVAMIVPCVNVISLLALSSQATAACRASGIPVGFLGPKVPPPPDPPVPPVRPA